MARLFDNDSSEYLYNLSAPVTTGPLTMSAWILPDDIASGGSKVVLGLFDTASANNRIMVYIAADDVAFLEQDSLAMPEARINDILTTTAWQHVAGIKISDSSRYVYRNGTKSAENTTSCTPASIDDVTVGGQRADTPSRYFSGSIAEPAIYNVALTDAEISMLALGVSPLLVRPQNLVFYPPLIGPANLDLVGGLTLTAAGTPEVSTHPPNIKPWWFRPWSWRKATGAPPEPPAAVSELMLMGVG